MEHDARAAIDLYGPKNSANLKSCWYLAQALLGLGRPQEAYDVAVEAYKASLAAKSNQTENLSRTVLRAKQQIWAAKETARLRDMNETLANVEKLIEADLNRELSELQAKLDKGEIGQIGFVEDQKALKEEAEKNVHNVREAFRIASNGDIQERVCFIKYPQEDTLELTHGSTGCSRLSDRRYHFRDHARPCDHPIWSQF